MDCGVDGPDGGGPARMRPRSLGHGGLLGILLALPIAAFSLIGMGRALGPHPVAPVTGTPTTAAATRVENAAGWCFGTPPAGAPDRLSRGYRFLWLFSGSYGDTAQETTWVYNRSCADPDANYPVLVIHITNGAVDDSDAGRAPGRTVDLGSSTATAVYYQRWLPHRLHTLLCSGGYWFPDQKVSCRWDAATVNLLLVNESDATYAVLGGRGNGIGENELAAIARRLPR